jgi:LysM repeat protein
MKKYNEYTSQLVGESVETMLSDKAKLSLYKKSSNSDIPVSILEEVYRRGYTIWNDQFGGTPEQFAFDRVNSFIAGGFAAQLDEDLLDEKRGLWDNIHAKRARIKAGSGEHMRKPGSKGAPTDAALKASQNEDADPCWKGYKQIGMKKKGGRSVPNCVPVKEEELNKKVMTPEQIADKHGVSVESLNKCLKRGIQVEKEHTTHTEKARRIALAHLGEDPNYYKKLDKAGLEEDAEAHSKDFRKPSSRFIGSNELVDVYKSQTPGQIIKKVVREHLQEVAMAMPPQVTPPAIVGQVRPGVRVAPRPTEVSGRASGRMAGQAGSMTGKVQTTRAAPPRAPTSTMPAGQAGSMRATPTKTSMSFSQGGSNVGQKMAAAKQTSPVVKGMADAGRSAMAGVEKAAPTVAKGLGTAARIAGGPVVGGVLAAMDPTPAGEKKSEFQRQKDLGITRDRSKENVTPGMGNTKNIEPVKGGSITTKAPDYFKGQVGDYKVKAGETLSGIAAKTGQSVDALMAKNPIASQNKIAAGAQIFTGDVPTPPKRPETESGGKTLKKIKEAISEATYKGKTVPLNKPMAGDVKKSKVFVDPDGDGKAQKVNFGDKNMSIKKDQPARKSSYCARSGGIKGTNDKTSANYWSRRAWNCEETDNENGAE